jgi:UPF0716 protein FxsA
MNLYGGFINNAAAKANNMRIFLFLLIVILPVTELYGLMMAGGKFGAWPVILWVIFAAAAGIWILSRLGERGLRRFQQMSRQTGQPLQALFYSFLPIVAAVLLVIPGLLTDAAALLLLLPPLRHWLAWLLARRFGLLHPIQPQAPQSTLEGEYQREEDEALSQLRPPDAGQGRQDS